MLQSYLGKIITDFCSAYGASVDILGFENEKVPEVQLSTDVVKGIRNIVSSVSYGKNNNPEYSILLDQWVEYAITNAAYLQNPSNTTHILKELNEYLTDKVYFVGNKLGPVDVLLYLFVYDIMVILSFQEKEKFINVSRWFDNVQQDNRLRSLRNSVHFSQSRLYI